MKKRMRRIAAMFLGMSMLASAAMPVFAGDSDEVVKLTWHVIGNEQQDMQTVMDAVNAITVPEIGVELDMQMYATSEFVDKMQMMLAAGEEIDLMFVGYINTYADLLSKGGLMDITDMLSPEFLDTLNPILKNACTVDGKIYAIPNEQVFGTQTAIAVQHDLAEEFGLDIESVKSAKDLEEFWAWVRDEKTDYYPMRSINMTTALLSDENKTTQLVSAAGYLQRDALDGDGSIEIINMFGDYEYELAKQRYEWYEQGFVRKDVLTTTTDSADYSSNKYASFFVGWKPGYDTQLNTAMGIDYDIIKIDNELVYGGGALSTMIGVPITCEHPEEAVDFIELVNTNKELYNLICFGVEGVHYTLDEEGKVVENQESGYYQSSGDWKFGNQFNALVRAGQPDTIWEDTKAFNESMIENPLASFIFDNTNVATQIASCQTVIDQYNNVINSGAQNPDEYWDEFQEALTKAGLDDIIAEAQTQVDAYMADYVANK